LHPLQWLAKLSRIFVIEVPAVERKPKYRHLIRAVEGLETAF